MQLKPAVNKTDHIQGNKNATVELVEFGDYQCPHCGAAYPVIKEIQETFGDQIKFIFRNFPLSEIHPAARPAAIAAEAAALQDKFWEMHDTIFENQNRLSSNFLLKLAENLSLDITQFNTDIESDSMNEKVDNDFESGVRSGVNGTPTFFVNGKRFDGGAVDLLEMLKESAK
jgi:protein-disulfide isomerase